MPSDDILAARNLAFHRYFISNIFLSDVYITLMTLVSLGLAIAISLALASGSLSHPFPVFDHPEKAPSTTSRISSLLSTFSSHPFVHRLVYNSLPVFYFALVGTPIILSDTWHRIHWPTYAMLWWNCAALLFSRPDVAYCAGRGLATILDAASYCYDSPLITDEAFRYDEPSDRMEHANARLLVAKDLYQYGYYVGRGSDAGMKRRRLGFSVARRHVPSSAREDNDEEEEEEEEEEGEEVKVEPVDRVKLRYRFLRFQTFWFFRHPTVGPNDRGEVAVDEKEARPQGLSGLRDISYLAQQQQQAEFPGGQREENGEEV